jgi:hypothetical protein
MLAPAASISHRWILQSIEVRRQEFACDKAAIFRLAATRPPPHLQSKFFLQKSMR